VISSSVLRLSLVVLATLGAACAASPPPAPTPPPPEPAKAQLVSATIAVNGCAALAGANSRLAEEAMHRLVDACTSVPGGSTRFTVTLLPGGRIDLTQGPDQPDTIPTCVLKNDLRHRVALPKPCSLVVKLEETSVPLADVDAGERDAR
jgi:hypothetical protein